MNPTQRPRERGTDAPAEGVHLEDYWRVIQRRGWLVILTTLIAVLAATWSASQRPQLYRSSLTLQVGDPRGRMGQLGDLDVSPNMLWTDPVESEVQQLTTQAVAQYVVDTLELRLQTPEISRPLLLERVRLDPEARPGRHTLRVGEDGTVAMEDAESATGRVGQPLRFGEGVIVVREGAPAGEYTLTVLSQLAAEALVTGGLAASTRPETNLIDVTYTGRDEYLAPSILNGVAVALRDLGVRRIRQWARARTGFIREQLEEAGRELQGALLAVEEYKRERGVTSLGSEETRVLQRIAGLQNELEQLIIERTLYERLLAEVDRTGPRSGDVQRFAALSTGQVNRTVEFYFDQLLELLEERSSQLGPLGKDPSHPAIIALDQRIEETEGQLVEAAANAAAVIDSRIDALSRALGDLQGELRQLPSVETELARLENEVEIHSDMYKYLLSRHQESQIAEAEISPYVDVLDPATWARPVSGRRWINIILGGMLGLLLGVAGAFFLEYLDRSIKSTADVETHLGVTVIGWIPRLEEAEAKRPVHLVAVSDPESAAAEAYRVLRTNLAFSATREERLGSIVLTSPGPGEGKTTTAANLAAVLATRGDRTLLVDADLRRGQLHEAFDLLRSPGLSDLLVGQLDEREAIRPEVRPGLDLLPAGKRPPNPSELLGSQVMANFLAGWRETYRWVLFDAPPILAVADAAVLAALTDAAVLVLKAGETDRRVGVQALEQLKRVDARTVGAVLNAVTSEHTSGRYYVGYYTRG